MISLKCELRCSEARGSVALQILKHDHTHGVENQVNYANSCSMSSTISTLFSRLDTTMTGRHRKLEFVLGHGNCAHFARACVRGMISWDNV